MELYYQMETRLQRKIRHLMEKLFQWVYSRVEPEKQWDMVVWKFRYERKREERVRRELCKAIEQIAIK